jgi:hypothetical protein
MQGRSLWPLLNGETDLAHHRDDVYCEYYNAGSTYEQLPFATMVRDAHAKLVAFHGSEPGELYDLQKDPTETNNLWDDPGSTPLKVRMLKLLCDRMAQTVDPLPLREAYW